VRIESDQLGSSATEALRQRSKVGLNITRRPRRPVARTRIERAAFGLLDASPLCAISTGSPRGAAHVSTAYFAWSLGSASTGFPIPTPDTPATSALARHSDRGLRRPPRMGRTRPGHPAVGIDVSTPSNRDRTRRVTLRRPLPAMQRLTSAPTGCTIPHRPTDGVRRARVRSRDIRHRAYRHRTGPDLGTNSSLRRNRRRLRPSRLTAFPEGWWATSAHRLRRRWNRSSAMHSAARCDP